MQSGRAIAGSCNAEAAAGEKLGGGFAFCRSCTDQLTVSTLMGLAGRQAAGRPRAALFRSRQQVGTIANWAVAAPLGATGSGRCISAAPSLYFMQASVRATIQEAVSLPATNGVPTSNGVHPPGVIPGRPVLEVPGLDLRRGPTTLPAGRLVQQQALGRLRVFSGSANPVGGLHGGAPVSSDRRAPVMNQASCMPCTLPGPVTRGGTLSRDGAGQGEAQEVR
jgi:hypothetical protein